MSDHNCPKVTAAITPGFPVYNHDTPCDICHAKSKKRLERYTKYLQELRAWVSDAVDLSDGCSELLYNHFFDDMDYGTQTGDTGTFDEWLADRPRYVADLISDIEFYYPELELIEEPA